LLTLAVDEFGGALGDDFEVMEPPRCQCESHLTKRGFLLDQPVKPATEKKRGKEIKLAIKKVSTSVSSSHGPPIIRLD